MTYRGKKRYKNLYLALLYDTKIQEAGQKVTSIRVQYQSTESVNSISCKP